MNEAQQEFAQVIIDLHNQGYTPPYTLTIGDGEGQSITFDVSLSWELHNERGDCIAGASNPGFIQRESLESGPAKLRRMVTVSPVGSVQFADGRCDLPAGLLPGAEGDGEGENEAGDGPGS